MVTVKQLAKVYPNSTLALQNTNLKINEGEFVSIVGPSGCGKSTLLKIIAGLSPITSGEVMVMGKPPTKGLKFTSFVFQEANLLPWHTVIANVALPLELAGISRKQRLKKAKGVLELVGLSNYLKAYPKELSGGMSMRVSIARALITEPRLLLMDEPFGALDEITRQKLNLELLRIKKTTKATIIYVTHNVFEAIFLSQRVLVFSASPGKVIQEIIVDSPPERTKSFFGSEMFSQTVMQVIKALK